jgi:hypothetical protein
MRVQVVAALVFFVAVLSGCSKVVLKSDADPNADLSSLETFYVRNFQPDKRGLERIIASELQDLGYQATSGIAQEPPTPVDAIVTYQDRWMWDITMYMLEINIQFHQPDTGYVFASGNSYRTSLVRESPEYMIEAVLREMLGKGPMPAKNEEQVEVEME